VRSQANYYLSVLPNQYHLNSTIQYSSSLPRILITPTTFFSSVPPSLYHITSIFLAVCIGARIIAKGRRTLSVYYFVRRTTPFVSPISISFFLLLAQLNMLYWIESLKYTKHAPPHILYFPPISEISTFICSFSFSFRCQLFYRYPRSLALFSIIRIPYLLSLFLLSPFSFSPFSTSFYLTFIRSFDFSFIHSSSWFLSPFAFSFFQFIYHDCFFVDRFFWSGRFTLPCIFFFYSSFLSSFFSSFSDFRSLISLSFIKIFPFQQTDYKGYFPYIPLFCAASPVLSFFSLLFIHLSFHLFFVFRCECWSPDFSFFLSILFPPPSFPLSVSLSGCLLDWDIESRISVAIC